MDLSQLFQSQPEKDFEEEWKAMRHLDLIRQLYFSQDRNIQEGGLDQMFPRQPNLNLQTLMREVRRTNSQMRYLPDENIPAWIDPIRARKWM